VGKAKVVILRARGISDSSQSLSSQQVKKMFTRGFLLLTAKKDISQGVKTIFREGERIGIKINTLGGKNISTRPEVSLALAKVLMEGGIDERNIIIWDRTNRELKETGYSLNAGGGGIRILGTDTEGFGYTPELVSHLNIGSRFSAIQTRHVHSSISLAILKDHGLSGVTAGMKNYFGAVHNPNKYHDDNCNPYVAEVFDTPVVKTKHKLTILDALTVQYHRGPSFHPRWAARYGALVFSFDPVAADFTGWRIIDKLRAQNGLSSLEEEKRSPLYLDTAVRMGLGKASTEEITFLEEEIEI
jgi:uncharacterized protein (DUF362 family)